MLYLGNFLLSAEKKKIMLYEQDKFTTYDGCQSVRQQ